MGKLCDIERVIIILMEQTIEIKKRHQSKSAKMKIHGKIQKKKLHTKLFEKKNLVDFEKERKETKSDNKKQTSCERVSETKQTKTYARLSFVGTPWRKNLTDRCFLVRELSPWYCSNP